MSVGLVPFCSQDVYRAQVQQHPIDTLTFDQNIFFNRKTPFVFVNVHYIIVKEPEKYIFKIKVKEYELSP